MDIKDYYFHTIMKDNDTDSLYNHLEKILKDRMLKSQKLLHTNEIKFNGLDYISLASFVEVSSYKVFALEKKDYDKSKLFSMFNSYEEYLEYLKLDNWLERPLSKDIFFKKYNTVDKRDYYKYLDSISRRYPVDIKYLYDSTLDVLYKYVLDIINDDILWCNKSEYCFEEYIRYSNGITFIFPKTIETIGVNVIPNMPFEVEKELVMNLQNLSSRYSNQIGEVQAKDFIDLNCVVGIIINDCINKEVVGDLLNKYDFNIKLYKLVNNELIEIE